MLSKESISFRKLCRFAAFASILACCIFVFTWSAQEWMIEDIYIFGARYWRRN